MNPKEKRMNQNQNEQPLSSKCCRNKINKIKTKNIFELVFFISFSFFRFSSSSSACSLLLLMLLRVFCVSSIFHFGNVIHAHAGLEKHRWPHLCVELYVEVGKICRRANGRTYINPKVNAYGCAVATFKKILITDFIRFRSGDAFLFASLAARYAYAFTSTHTFADDMANANYMYRCCYLFRFIDVVIVNRIVAVPWPSSVVDFSDFIFLFDWH